MTSGAFGAVGGVATFASAGIASAIVGGIATAGIMGALGIATKALGLGPSPPKVPPSQTDRLRASIDVRAPRKIVFGYTAMATDVHYQEFTGSDQEYLNSIIVTASHRVHTFDEIWFDQELAWSLSTGIQPKFSGYLDVGYRGEGWAGVSFPITGSSNWTPANGCHLTGCAYIWLRYKLTGSGKKAESPFSGSVTSRITIRGRGAFLYDPRLDSTRGGSGSHRADDQSTWAWVSDNVGRNPALQLLWYMLGWKIESKLAVGLGIPPARIDIASFSAAANICDESVALAAGGTEPRYRADGVFSEGDDPGLVFENLLAAMNGVLRDNGGQFALDILVNDLASPVIDLTEADVIGEFQWLPTPPLHETFNTVRGRYVDSSNNSLYQMVDYPDVVIDSADGIDRPANFDLPMVQSASQAQRLAKQFLQRAQYPGTFAADFLASAWRCRVGSVITLTFPSLGFEEKLFRVVEHAIRPDGICPMVLREENAAIYAWDADESPAVIAATPTTYDPINDPITSALIDVDLNTAWTERYPNPRPYDRPTGGLYIDEFDRVYRFERVLLEFDGDPVTIGGSELYTGEYTEVTSDYSSVLEGDNAIAFIADFQGAVIAGQLPAYIKIQRTRGSADVSDVADWSIVDQGCTATIDTEGLIEITAVTATGFIDVTSDYNDVVLGKRISVIVQQQAVPNTGGTGVTTATDTSIAGTSSASYGSANAGPLTVTAGASGTVALTATLQFYGAPGDGVWGKWQWRVPAGSWADVTSELGSDYPASSTSFFGGSIPVPGHISVTMNKASLTPGSDYEFQLLLRRVSGATAITFTGTATATAT